MERRVEELLKTLHSLAFTDSDSIINEIRQLVLSPNTSAPSVAFFSSKLLNSEVSLLQFILKNRTESDRLIWKTTSNALTLVSDYIRERGTRITEYAIEIKDTCLQLMASSTKSSMVKEAALRPLTRMLEVFSPIRLKEILNPGELFRILLDNKLKFEERTLGSTLKGSIFNMLGLLISKFEEELEDRVKELQKIMLVRLKEELYKGSKTEEKTVAGILKGFAHGLRCFKLDDGELKEVFSYVKALLTPIQTGRYTVLKSSLKVLSENTGVFKQLVHKNCQEVLRELFNLSKSNNSSVKYLAQETTENVLSVLVESIIETQDQACFEYTLKLLTSQITSKSPEILQTTIKNIAVFSQAISIFKSEDYLKSLLQTIIDLSKDSISPESEPEDFKGMILGQKRLNSLLKAYSDIARSLKSVPESALLHFSEVSIEIFRKNYIWHKNYRAKLYNSLAQLFAALYMHSETFTQWIRVFIVKAMKQLLVFEESNGRIEAAAKLWIGVLEQECLTENILLILTDEILRFFYQLVLTLDLNYAIIDGKIEPSNPEDQIVLFQASEFSNIFWPQIHKRLSSWISPFITLLSRKIAEHPMLPSLYNMARVTLKVCDLSSYCDQDLQCKSQILSLINSIISSMQNFQDALLSSCIELCLSVPISIIFSTNFNNIHLFQPVILQALNLSLSYLPLAHTVITTLNSWRKSIPMPILQSILPTILPALSPFLTIDKITQEISGQEELKKSRQKKRTVAFRIFKFLGSLGGASHFIVNSGKNDSFFNFQTDLKVRVRLNNRDLEVNFDQILPRVLHLAEKSNEAKTKIAACELLHAVVLFMIGRRTESESQFDKIYLFVFPVVFRLATDLDPLARQLFEPLTKQVVRWFAKKFTFDNPETQALLLTLQESVCSPNSALRNLAAECIGEFCKYTVMFNIDPLPNFKSTLKRIQSFSSHPQADKRRAAVLCLHKILVPLSQNDYLIGKFLLEFAHEIFVTTKLSHYDKNDEILKLCSETLLDLKEVFKAKVKILVGSGEERRIHKDIFGFIEWIWEFCMRPERVVRGFAQDYWKELSVLAGFDVVKWKKGKNFQADLASWKDSVALEGVVDFYLWISECGIFSWTGEDLLPQIENFIKSDKSHLQPTDTIRAYLVILKYNRYFPIPSITPEFLLEILICPQSVGLYSNAETKDLIDLYSELSQKSLEMLKNLGLYSKSVTALFNTINLDNERNLKLALQGIEQLIHSQSSLKPDLTIQISLNLEQTMIALLKKSSNSDIRKGKLILDYLISTEISPNCVKNILTNSHLMNFCSDNIFEYILLHLERHLETFFLCFIQKPEQLLTLLVPILEKGKILIEKKMIDLRFFDKCFIKHLVPLFSTLILVPSAELSLGIIRVYCIFIEFSKDLSIFDEGIQEISSTDFFSHISQLLHKFFNPDQQFSVKKEALRLLVASWEIFGDRVLIEVKNDLQDIQNTYFLSSSQSLASKQTDSDTMIKSFLELFLHIKNFYALELLFGVLREQQSRFEPELKYVIGEFIKHQVGMDLGNTFRMLMKVFFDSESDQGLYDNVRWGIVNRIISPLIEGIDELLAEELMIGCCKELITKLVETKFVAITQGKEYLLILREKTAILSIFEKFLAKVPSSRFKENVHKAVYGPAAQGNELTKQIIAFCDKYRKELPERNEVIETIQNSKEYIRAFVQASYACLLTCIRKTQSQEKVFFNFLFKDLNWKNLIEDKEDFNFKPQTPDYRKENPVKSVAPTKISNIYISSSLFSQQVSVLKPEKPKQSQNEDFSSIDLEPDDLNSIIIMKPLLEVIEKMESLFMNPTEMPQWMQCLHTVLSDPFSYTSVKLFIIKIILNRPKSFENWSNLWIAPICTTMQGKNGGKGLHYFLRDTCTLLLYDWEEVQILNKEKECGKFLNYLIKVAADTNIQIFESNIQLISTMINKWRLPVDHGYIEGMLKKSVNEEDSKVGATWKMTGILLYGICIDAKVKVLENGKENLQVIDECLVKCLDANRRSIVSAAAEVIGKRLNYAAGLMGVVLEVLKKKEVKDVGIYVNILEKITIFYPQVLDHKGVSNKINALISSLSGNIRGFLFAAVLNYVKYLKASDQLNNLPDICEFIHREKERIANDNEDLHRLALLKLVLALLEFLSNSSVQKVVSGVILLLGAFASASNLEIRKYLYETMQKAYDLSEMMIDPVAIRSKAREILLKGLSDSAHSEFILTFWDSKDRLSEDPQTRMLQCLSEVYTPECEELWLVVSSHLLVRLSKLSVDYEKVLFQQPLDNCEFKYVSFANEGKSSLPMTPMFSPSYFHQESLTKKPISSSSQYLAPKPSRIRHFNEFSQANQEERQKRVLKTQLEKIEQRIQEQKSRSATILRTYRSGDLPDIQISLNDLISPLLNLILLDCEIASHIWVSLCPKLFLQLDNESRKKIIKAINRVFEISQNCTPDVISCMHRTIRELVIISSNFAKEISPKHIYSSGVKSMCYQSAIMLLQECLLRFDVVKTFKAHSGNEVQRVTKDNKDFWVYLTKVYEKMGDLESVKGLWVKIFEDTCPSIVGEIEEALNSKTSGDMETANGVYLKVIPHVSTELRGMLSSEYEDSLAHMGKWQILSENVKTVNSTKIKALFRLNKFAELTELVQTLPGIALYTRYPYEMSLLNITQDDNDRARYYMDQEFSRFVEKWQALNPLSVIAKHKLIQKVQKVYDLTEYLSIKDQKKGESQEEYIERVHSVVSEWYTRVPSMALDDFSTWEEILFGRVLYFDKIKANFEFDLGELNDFPSLLYAKFSEFPLKMGWFQVSEIMLKESLNKRNDYSKVNFNILAPVLKLRAKIMDSEGYSSETGKIVKYFYNLIDRLKVNSDMQSEKTILLYGQLQKYLVKGLIDREEAVNELREAAKESYRSFESVQAVFPLKFGRFCDMVLRKLEQNEKLIHKVLNEIQICPQTLALNVVYSCLTSMKTGNQRANDMFPRLISLLKYGETHKVFKTELKSVPEWMLVKWIGQILAIFDRPECDVFKEIVERVIKNYPQVFFYYYRTFMSVDSYATYCKIFKGFRSETWKMVDEELNKLVYLQDFTEALDQLTYPEHRLKSYLDLFTEGIASNASSDYFGYLAQELCCSIVCPKAPGVYNKKFANDWEKVFKSVLAGPLTNLHLKSCNEIAQFVNAVKAKLNDTPFDKPTTLISTFSEWLADYSIDPYTQFSIDIPWLISGNSHLNLEKPVKIVSFDQNVLILRSVRKPKRIGIHGSDEKLYFAMVKGGEDLRLDHRIEQVFTVMNRIFLSSPDCAKSDLHLKTFNITPITKRLGIIEWVNNTEPLRETLDYELDRHYKIKGIGQTQANLLRKTWLKSLIGAGDDNYIQHHLIALGKDAESIVSHFKTHESSIPWDLIRQSLLTMGQTPESYMYLRKQFIHSLAAICIAGYVIGLGDRHLDNFLLDKSDGGLVLIDFGVSFGQGVNLGIPELMPFRMTRQFLSVFSPEGLKGELRYSMINCLKALRKNQNILLDYCEVFINEPLQDWIKGQNAEKNMPTRKLSILKKKLNGGNSSSIMLEELQDSKHFNTVQFI